MKKNSLFERIGGYEVIYATVDLFYTKILSDNTINFFFKDLDITSHKFKMRSFLSYAFGAPTEYEGKNLLDAHGHLLISEANFDTVSNHLLATLRELQIAQNEINEIMQIVAGTRNDILGS